MMLDKKQIGAIFLFEFKMCCKAVETTCNINNAFGPGTANEHTVQYHTFLYESPIVHFPRMSSNTSQRF